MTQGLRIQDAIDTVGRILDLTGTEAAIYVRLCLAGPAKAGDLAASLKLHRNEVYRAASRLVARGLAELTLERPARYAAFAPETVFDSEITQRLQAVEELKHARDSISPLLTQLQVDAGPAPRSTYKVVQGRAEIYALRDRLIASATSSIDWATTFPASLTLTDMTGGLDAMRKLADAGVDVRMLLRAPPHALPKLKPFEGHEHVGMRVAPVEQTVRFLIVNKTELLMWVVNDPSESLHARDEVAIHTTARGFVEAEAMFFDQLWSRAAPIILP